MEIQPHVSEPAVLDMVSKNDGFTPHRWPLKNENMMIPPNGLFENHVACLSFCGLLYQSHVFLHSFAG